MTILKWMNIMQWRDIMKTRLLPVAILGVLALWLGGCAVQPAKTPEQALAERARTYWDAAKVRDLSTLYRLEADALEGKLTPDAFSQRMSSPSQLISYEFKQIQIHGKEAEIEVATKFAIPKLHQPFTDTTKDHWILIDGQWYHQTPVSLFGR